MAGSRLDRKYEGRFGQSNAIGKGFQLFHFLEPVSGKEAGGRAIHTWEQLLWLG